MYSEDTLLRLIERIYDAALAPELWPEFLEALAEVTNGHHANLAYADTRRNEIAVVATARFDPETLRQYGEYYGTLDPWVKSGTAKGFFRTGGMGLGSWVVSASDLQRTEFYNDFGQRYGIDGGISVILRLEHGVALALSVTQRGREFGEAEVGLVKRLLPHLQRAFQIHERLAGVSDKRSATEEVIDRMPFGVVLLDAAGRAVFVNTGAQQILDSCDGLMLREKSLLTTTLPQTTELRALIAGAIAASRGEPLLGSGGALAIRRPSLKRPLQVLVTPLRAAGASFTSSSAAAGAAVFISDPELPTLTDAAMLRQFFGFTAAETRFAAQFLEHKSVEEAADFLEVSLNTALNLRAQFATKPRRHPDGVQTGDSICAVANGNASHVYLPRPPSGRLESNALRSRRVALFPQPRCGGSLSRWLLGDASANVVVLYGGTPMWP